MPRGRGKFSNHRYGTVHQSERKRWARQVRLGYVQCWRCERLISPTANWDLGHVDERGRARGYPLRHPEHRHSRDCPAGGNRATVTHLKQKLAEQGGSRQW
jgi:hypothetical protein